jgi:hypothetical protein
MVKPIKNKPQNKVGVFWGYLENTILRKLIKTRLA